MSGVSVDEVSEALVGPRRLILLDDDPTGTQTVRDIPVLTSWDQEDIRWALDQPSPGFFILTNSRSLSPDHARDLIKEVVTACLQAAAQSGHVVVFASRGDSTLRGHFPLETDAIAEVLAAHGRPVDAVLLAPAYFDAGRVTLDGIHWLREAGGGLQPVSESEFAQDATFSYVSARLNEWVEEKSGGRIPADQVLELPLTAVRGTLDELTGSIARATEGQVVVVDGVDDSDLRAVALAALAAERAGSELVYRVGPSFARAGLGQASSAPIADDELAAVVTSNGHGLVVVGSHVALTTRQLNGLVARRDVTILELDVSKVFDPSTLTYLDDLVNSGVSALSRRTVVLRTTRTLLSGEDAAQSLGIATAVSRALVTTVRRIVRAERPAWVLGKGGITSSDVATEALGINRAIVRGPILHGIVSLWEAAGGWAAGLPYVVFAGNVGDDDALARVVDRLELARTRNMTKGPQ